MDPLITYLTIGACVGLFTTMPALDQDPWGMHLHDPGDLMAVMLFSFLFWPITLAVWIDTNSR